MPHLAKFRKGWSNENLAQYILYKFAFTANPSKIADDIGIDFICTLFKTEKIKRTTYLYPKNSFAIQIKSNRRNIPITNNIDFYNNLEMPFYVGIINNKEFLLTIYSGEFLQPFITYKGKDLELQIKLTDRKENYTIDDYFEETVKNKYLLHFPFLVEIGIDDKKEDFKEKVDLLEKSSSMILDNISSKRNHEYIYKIQGRSIEQLLMFAGSGSVRAFRENVINRITEAFYNLNWLFDNNPKLVNFEEFQMYKNLFDELNQIEIYKPLPKFLIDSYTSLVAKMNK